MSRIVHVSDAYLPRLGGVERHVHDLVEQQRALMLNAEVVTITRDSMPTAGVTRLKAVDLRQLRPLLRRADAVHCHTSLVSPLAWAAARTAVSLGAPTVITMHSVVPARGPIPTALNAVDAASKRRVLWTAVSQVAAESVQQAIGRPVSVLPNGVDPSFWTHAPVGTRPVPTIVAVNRLATRKRVLQLVDILAKVRDERGQGSFNAVIAGDGPLLPALKRIVSHRGLSDMVSLPGRISRQQVADLLGRADLFVAPAFLESFGIAALEARCAAVPVVAMKSGGVGEFVRDGVEGHLVADDAEMVTTISGLIERRGDLLRLAMNSASTPVAVAWPTVLRTTLKAYEAAGALLPVIAAEPAGSELVPGSHRP